MCLWGGEGAGFKIFERIFLFIVRVLLSEFLRMYVELSAALKIFENFLFSFNGGQNFSILIGRAAKRTRS